jgi:hypothetical protein
VIGSSSATVSAGPMPGKHADRGAERVPASPHRVRGVSATRNREQLAHQKNAAGSVTPSRA